MAMTPKVDMAILVRILDGNMREKGLKGGGWGEKVGREGEREECEGSVLRVQCVESICVHGGRCGEGRRMYVWSPFMEPCMEPFMEPFKTFASVVIS